MLDDGYDLVEAYEVIEEKAKICQKWDCENLFIPNSNRQAYCSEDCKYEQKDALERLQKHGTYLTEKQRWNELTEYPIKKEFTMDREQKRHWVNITALDSQKEYVPYKEINRDEADNYHELNKEQLVKTYRIEDYEDL